MRMVFSTDNIQAEANSFHLMVTRYGELKARRIRQRLDEIAAVAHLEDLAKLPATGCHCMEEDKSLVGVITIRPAILVFGIAKNFDFDVDLTKAIWGKVVLVEIMSLDRETK